MDRLFKINWFGGPTEPGEKNFLNDNHIFSLIMLLVLSLIISILIYVAVKRQRADKAPNAAIIIVEACITVGDNFSSETHERRFDKMNPYFISLFVFFLFGNLISLFGLAPIGSSLAVIFAATAVTWFGTIGIGIAYNKIKYVLKLVNPLEIASNFSPLISLTFRMYGNIIGGVVLITLFGLFLDNIWAKMIGATMTSAAGQINPLGVLLIPALNMYFDLFDDAIQAFVFMILTMSYWFQASEVEVKEKHKEKIREWKKQVIKNKQQNNQSDPAPSNEASDAASATSVAA
ncbi:F0F1 ATP synthase subunit A [Metamycoplasma neophronis]|uniref:F0F1 ATP synthase subunit A n=1 Tax=Metamycoplasma neophronis TaxID=872983 RepID=A0ABY2Z5M7_9BACT|nr:F0F1 ATP synthase subunit A [Metamycoplasma neophronis]TPR54329.1 F0F1 ATP synthase subunit A [Metamycoplasma neophronis]